MRTIFSKIRLNRYQIIGLSILVLISAVGEMLLPSLRKNNFYFGCRDGRDCGHGMYCQLFISKACYTDFY